MMKPRIIPALVWLTIISYLSLMPGSEVPHSGLFGIPHLDKMVHVVMYGVLAFLLARTFRVRRISRLLLILLFCVLFGGAMEILQATVAINRSASWADLLANATGAFSGVIVFRWSSSCKKHWTFTTSR